MLDCKENRQITCYPDRLSADMPGQAIMRILGAVLDGVYRRGVDGEPLFVEVPAPTDEALRAVWPSHISDL